MHSRRGVRWSGFDRAFCRNVLAVRPKNAPAPRKILSSRPDSGIPSLRSRNSRIGQGGKTAFIFPMLSLQSLDLGTRGPEFLFDFLVAAIEVVDAINDCDSLGNECRYHQRCA